MGGKNEDFLTDEENNFLFTFPSGRVFGTTKTSRQERGRGHHTHTHTHTRAGRVALALLPVWKLATDWPSGPPALPPPPPPPPHRALPSSPPMPHLPLLLLHPATHSDPTIHTHTHIRTHAYTFDSPSPSPPTARLSFILRS